MLGTLCTLITVLSCVSGVTVVTQKPPVLTVSKGDTATMDCNLGTVTGSAARWYKQVPGSAPQFVLRFHKSWSSPSWVLQPLLSSHSNLLISQLDSKGRSHHTDNMLGTLCTLIALLSCVSGVTVVTQKPPVLPVSKGDTATMDCNLGTVTNSAARWYKQVPGSAPQFVLYFYHPNSSPTYGAGFSSSRFTSNHQSKSDYRLIIKNVEAGDSAVYYCKTWDSSAKEYVSQ
ncbi:hypothetical protein SKAU_G00301630 [Synaphobranchus kaupii]|uniref:Ig-like domain-containing protein n=1 Tax=Synaphobranchus kaupii TaxID=118154 RepID=A0A9Q1IL83_SYNKA|nr:hypothetical protein SKAU_G00301630 [Synaphobranchus kaupii]